VFDGQQVVMFSSSDSMPYVTSELVSPGSKIKLWNLIFRNLLLNFDSTSTKLLPMCMQHFGVIASKSINVTTLCRLESILQ
jgi:hypothetical protein